MKIGRRFSGLFALLLILAFTSTSQAAVTSNPVLNLDGAVASSLNTVTVPSGSWNDLSGSGLSFSFGANTGGTSNGGGALVLRANSGSSGAYLAPGAAAGSASNPSGDISLFTWIYLTSWNADWNIIASRWFNGVAGGGGAGYSDYHFAVKSSGSAHKLNLYTTGNSEIYGTRDFSLNKWYHIGFTLNGTNLAFYVNGKYDTPTVTTGVSRTAYTTNYLFVGDLRNTCTACAMNGYLAKFRLWSSALTQSAVLTDYQNEANGFGYSSTPTLSLSNTAPKFRISNTITATVSTPGKVSFYEKGKIIRGCKNVNVSSTTGTCTWKPSSHGVTSISASFSPTDTDFVSSAATQNFIVSARTTTR
jgi:hypothetical protein